MDLYLKHNGLSRKALFMVVLGEGHVQLGLLTGLLPDELFLEAVDKGMGPDLQGMALSLSAFKGFSVQEALEIDLCGIALCDLALLLHASGVAVSFLLDLALHVLIGHGGIHLLHLHALILAQLHLRTLRHLRGKDKGLSLLDLDNLHRRGGNDIHTAFVHGLFIVILDQDIGGLLVEHLRSVHFLDNLPRHLSLTEAIDPDPVSLLQIGLVQSRLHLLLGDLDGQLYHVFFQIFYLNVHL